MPAGNAGPRRSCPGGVSVLRFRPRRWLVHIALAFGAGVYLGWGRAVSLLWLAGAALCALWIGLLRRRRLSPYLPCLGLALMLGLLRCALAQPALPPEGSYTVTATVTGEPRVRESDGRVAVYLKNVRLSGVPGRCRAYWTYWPEDAEAPLPLDGQTVVFAGKLYHPAGRVNPHGFDFRLYLLQKGVPVGISGAAELAVSPADQAAPRSALLRLRQGIRQRFRLLLGEQSPLAQALVLNDKNDFPEDLAQRFRQAGVAHVLAVSGLHVMVLFACVTLILRRFSPSQALTTMISAVLLGAYALLVGAQAPVLRAALLVLYMQLGRITRRKRDPLTALAAAFALVLLLRPLDLFAAGFQMSFCAVLGMTLLGDRLNCLLRPVRQPLARKQLSAYGLTVCANLGVMLPVGWHYHRLSLAGLLINPLICAVVTMLLPLLLILLLVSCVYLPAGLLLGRAVALICRCVTGAVSAAAALPFSSILVPRLPMYATAAIVVALVLCTRYVLLSRRIRICAACGLLGASALIMVLTRPTDVRYIQLSVGNADAAVIEDGKSTLVIDTAENGSELANYLLSEGREVDRLILTHLHSDHALGLQQMLQYGVPIGEICLSTEALVTPVSESCRAVLALAQEQGIPIRRICAGDDIGTARVHVSVLWPEAGGANPLANANDFALALHIDLNGVTLLQMSDVSGGYELHAAWPAQVLKVAHHGSAASTSARFLRLVNPSVALMSARKASDRTLERLAEAGIPVYDTNTRGALTLTVKDGGVYLQGFLR